MKTEKLDFTHLINDRHFQIHTEFRDLVTTTGAENLKVEQQFSTYLTCFAEEDTAMNRITKSQYTPKLAAADKRRDTVYTGLVASNRALVNHFTEYTREAAGRIKIVFDAFGNISKKPNDAKTAAIYNLLQELNGARINDVKATVLEHWVTELEVANKEYESLVKLRDDEASTRTKLVMKEVRARLDEAFHAVIRRIDAFAEIEGGAVYDGFISRLNATIKRYKQA